MSYCEKCQGEHKPVRKIDSEPLGSLWYPARFVQQPEVLPQFIAWGQRFPGAPAESPSDDEMRAWLRNCLWMLTDLLHQIEPVEGETPSGPHTKFLVLRDTGLTDAARVVTAVSDDPLCNVAIGFSTEEGEMTAVNWLVSDADAHGLADGLRERLGEPDMDIAADHHGTEQMAEAFQENAIHTHKE